MSMMMVSAPSLPAAFSSLAPHDWRHSGQIRKHQRATSTRYVRSWTEEEEAYLLRQRQHKMPYKHIAIHLHKTELACRLHYHQMTSSKNRNSGAETFNVTESWHGTGPSTPSPPLNSSFPTSSTSPNARFLTPPRQSHIAIHDFASSPSLTQPATSGSHSRSQSIPEFPSRENVDLGRLHHVYADHRESFWSAIAEAYSNQVKVPPYELEAAFFTAQTSSPESVHSYCPTPILAPLRSSCPAPDINVTTRDTSTTPVHSPKPNRCTVSALLNAQEEQPHVE